MTRIAALALCAFFVALASSAQNWKAAMREFKQEDAEHPPASGGIVFVGSSSIRLWDTDAAFPEHDILNRGFGGSQTSDVVGYMDRAVLHYKPRLVVFYAGDNDIALGRKPESVVRFTKTFIDRVHSVLPETRIIYIAIKPSIARWQLVDKMREVNAAIAELAEADPLLDFLDVDTPLIGEDGMPRPELYVEDGLHLSEAGYAIWNDLIRPLLGEPAKE